jgi:glutaredoxin-like YruB-family protein
MNAKRGPRIVIFTTPSCPWCRMAKTYLRQNGFRFREVDVSKDPDAARDMIRRTGQRGVPVLLIGNKPVIGFDREKIDRLLGIR